MSYKLFIATTAFAGLSNGVWAQYVSDALLFSDLHATSTTRSIGVGNSMGAVGGDISCANSNPAGLAVQHKSEIVFSPGFAYNSTKADFAGERVGDSRTSFNLGSIGALIYNDIDSKWKNINFGVTYNRLANFNQNMSFSGVSYGSRIQNFVKGANGTAPANLDPFEEQLAYDTYLIDLVNPSTLEYSGALNDSTFVRKSQFVKQSGGIHELGISLAGNFDHRFYIGGTLGVDILNYREFKSYEELEETGSIDFKKMVFDETRTVKGTGINFKLGAIYRLNKHLRIGGYMHTPTAFRNTEQYSTSMYGEVKYHDTLQKNTYDSEQVGYYKYALRTPWTFGVSLGGVFMHPSSEVKRAAFFNLDVEYLNFSGMAFNTVANDTTVSIATKLYFNQMTNTLSNMHQGVLRLRLGGELALDDFRLRAGYQFQSSPYAARVDGVSDLRHDISVGIGIRGAVAFFDISYIHTVYGYSYMPYAPTSTINTQQILANGQRGLLSATLGFRFI